MATNNSVDVGLQGATGSGNFAGNTSPNIVTGFNDANGNVWISQTPQGTAINHINVQNAPTTVAPIISAVGGDTNIALQLTGKGTSGVLTQGTATNNNAPAGYVGEFVTSTNSAGVALTDIIAFNITSISLTPGDWDVWGNVYIAGGANNLNALFGWISTTSATYPTGFDYLVSLIDGLSTQLLSDWAAPVFPQRFSFAATTTVYLSCTADFLSSTATGYGVINARRVR